MKTIRERTGAVALVEALEKAGTEVLFGYPGGAVIDVFDSLKNAKFRFVLGRHEQGCAHMADGYARSSGKVGVCLVTSGPGATNVITGLGTAYLDGVPMVVITGQVPLSQIGTDAFQEADMSGICRAVTKHSFLVQSADEIPETVAQAFYIATHGKPGPVVIDIPKNCQQALTKAQYPERVSLRAYHPEHAATPRLISRFAKLLNEARRPVLYAGGGAIASCAAEELAQLAHKAQIPVVTTLMGLGAFDERDPLSLGMAGMHGAPCANYAIEHADLVVAMGVRFSDRVTGKVANYARKAKIVHIDCNPAEMNKNVPADLCIVADMRDVLAGVSPRVRANTHAEWLGELARRRREAPVAYRPLHADVIMPQQAIEAIDKVADGEAIVVTDVGQQQMWAAQYITHRHPRRFLTSGGMGTMGFGIPAAIGAALARPDLKTIAICGDGGAQMTFEEVVVAVLEKLPVKIVVINNGYLGMVRQWQELFYGKNYAHTALKAKDLPYLPDFVKLAEACGAEAYRVTDPARLERTMNKALASDRTTLVEVVVEPEANVLPMIYCGKSGKEKFFK